MKYSFDQIYQELCITLEERDRSFPARVYCNTKKMQNQLDLLFDYLEKKRKGVVWKPEEEVINVAKRIEEEAIIICGTMKSGTTLLLELLDGHFQLNVIPGDSWLWVRLRESTNKERLSAKTFRKHWLKRYINPKGQKPFWIFGENIQAYISALNYIDYWLENLPDHSRKPFLAAILTYFCANPEKSMKTEKWVEKTPGNEFRVKSFEKHFPKAKFIHM